MKTSKNGAQHVKYVKAKMRRKHLHSAFDSLSDSHLGLPRQHYGFDFYGMSKGEILVIVGLCTRETIFKYVTNRTQENMTRTVLNETIFSRNVPLSIRSDNAPELIQGLVIKMSKYLGIQQVVTGDHNPRENAICERANQTLGAVLRKLSNSEYAHIKEILPSLQFTVNTTHQSSIECTPFEAGHGLKARTIAEARFQRPMPQGEGGGDDGDLVGDAGSKFDKSLVHSTLELAARMGNTAQAVSGLES